MPLYTRKGDQGETSLYTGQRVSKSDLRVAVLGTLDELNAQLGVVRSWLESGGPRVKELDSILQKLQELLFNLGTELAGNKIASVDSEVIKNLEELIDHYSAELPELDRFILPGGSKPAARCHVARTVCRRAERLIVALDKKQGLNKSVLKFINRLSDTLFILARRINQLEGQQEIPWRGV